MQKLLYIGVVLSTVALNATEKPKPQLLLEVKIISVSKKEGFDPKKVDPNLILADSVIANQEPFRVPGSDEDYYLLVKKSKLLDTPQAVAQALDAITLNIPLPGLGSFGNLVTQKNTSGVCEPVVGK